MDHLSKEFKARSDKIIDGILVKVSQYKGDLPINPAMLQMGKSFMLDPLDGHARIKMFMEDSYHVWDSIHARDEKALIEALGKEVESKAPSASGLMSNVVNFVLSNRDQLLGKEYEEFLWNEVGDLIRMSIEYAHLKRERRPNEKGDLRYTVRFVPDVKLKVEAEKWDVTLL